MLSVGELAPFFTRPISGALAALIIGTIAWRLFTLRRRAVPAQPPSTAAAGNP